MKDDSFYLRHILECIDRVEEDTAPGIEAFRSSRMSQDAAFRNVLVHDYLGLYLQRIWEVTQRDVLDLKHSIQLMIEELS